MTNSQLPGSYSAAAIAQIACSLGLPPSALVARQAHPLQSCFGDAAGPAVEQRQQCLDLRDALKLQSCSFGVGYYGLSSACIT